jgi:hypothetical protein
LTARGRIQVLDNLLDGRSVDGLLSFDIAQRERVEAKVVNDARNPAAAFSNSFDSLASEKTWAVASGHPEPVVDICRDFVGTQGVEPSEHGDALVKLNQFARSKSVGQLRLSGQDYLHELGLSCLKVGKHADRFEDRVVKVLGLIQGQDNPAALAGLFEQRVIQPPLKIAQGVRAAAFQAHINGKVIEKLTRAGLHLKKECGTRTGANLIHQSKEQSSFAHPRRSNQRHETPPRLNPVHQRCEGLSMGSRQEQGRGVWRHSEGLPAKSVVGEKHAPPSSLYGLLCLAGPSRACRGTLLHPCRSDPISATFTVDESQTISSSLRKGEPSAAGRNFLRQAA